VGFPWPEKVALIFGNEVSGVLPPVLVQCEAVVHVPMRGLKNTINVATTLGVVVFEVLRQLDKQ
jgi:tRNA G18 (ribose-2'-O)-methylase SpoU